MSFYKSLDGTPKCGYCKILELDKSCFDLAEKFGLKFHFWKYSYPFQVTHSPAPKLLNL